MTKTSTPTHTVNFPKTQASENTACEAEQQDELFYNSIKPQLNELIKEPSAETIDKILAYSKVK
jgi:hypothetical protein